MKRSRPGLVSIVPSALALIAIWTFGAGCVAVGQ